MAEVDKVHNKMKSPNNCGPPTEECESNGDERGVGICMQSVEVVDRGLGAKIHSQARFWRLR